MRALLELRAAVVRAFARPLRQTVRRSNSLHVRARLPIRLARSPTIRGELQVDRFDSTRRVRAALQPVAGLGAKPRPAVRVWSPRA